MTTQIISRFCGLLISTLLIGSSFAQTSDYKNLEPVFVTGTKVNVYENILTEFNKQFPGAQNVRWTKVGKKYLAKFFMDDQDQRALLHRKAYVIYQISYGKEKHLPVDIRKGVKRMYVEYRISSATKVQEANRTIWVINVEDDTNLVFVRVEKDEIEEVQKYRKSNPQSTPHLPRAVAGA